MPSLTAPSSSSPIRVISVPKVTPIQSGPFSFSNMLKAEKTVDALYASGDLSKFQVPRANVPAKILKAGFEAAATFKIPMSALIGAGAKGTVYATRLVGPNQDHFAMYTPQGHRLAVRQKSDDYAPGFFWSNYQLQ